jgi:hypothetical protein
MFNSKSNGFKVFISASLILGCLSSILDRSTATAAALDRQIAGSNSNLIIDNYGIDCYAGNSNPIDTIILARGIKLNFKRSKSSKNEQHGNDRNQDSYNIDRLKRSENAIKMPRKQRQQEEAKIRRNDKAQGKRIRGENHSQTSKR